MAKKNVTNSSSGESGSFDKGLIRDIDGFAKSPSQWVSARNAVNNTSLGDIGELSNEASNYLCGSVPAGYEIIGVIHVGKDEWVIFSTDDTDSEIGLFKEDSCNYELIVNDRCLNFKKDNLVVGVGRTAFNCGKRVYWDDGLNPTRVLDIDNVPWIQICTDDNGSAPGGCITCVDTPDLDCDKIRLAPIIQDLAFRLEVGTSSGQLANGSYYVVGAYLTEGVRVTDYCIPSNVQGLFHHDDLSSSLNIYVEEADQNFDEFELILVKFSNFNVVATKLGIYSTRQKKITIDAVDETLTKIDPALIYVRNNIPDKSDGVFRNGDYLIRVGPTDKLDFNYQPLANQITAKWVSIEYDADYYRKGGSNTGYMRDESYAFFIRWVFNTGDKSASYHIPGRYVSNSSSEKQFISGTNDVLASQTINPVDSVVWKTYNTATVDPSFPGTGATLPDGGKILGGGDMGYWESTEFYDDDNPAMWNANTGNPAHDLCGKPIRHHRFPDNATDDPSNPFTQAYTTGEMITNHYDPTDGSKIRVMGVQFNNIKFPVDNQGNPMSNIAGYEILRGTRLGNKTVFAKGMINNLRTYIPMGSSNKEFLYPNYPYNPTTPIPAAWKKAQANPTAIVDHFLSSETDNDGTGTKYNSNFTFFGLSNSTSYNDFNAYLSNDTPLGYPFTNPFNNKSYFQGSNTSGNVKRDMFTFHSPETNFRDPFLSAKELKIYGELTGEMEGKFQIPENHPKHKFIGNSSFFAAIILGLGYAVIETEGQKETEHISPTVDFGGTYAQVGASTGATGLFGPGAGQAASIAAAAAAAQTADTATELTLSNSMLTMLISAAGVDSSLARDKALEASGTTSGSIAGVGHTKKVKTIKSAWQALPDLLRLTQGVPTFLSLWSQGIDKVLNLIYAFTPYKHYALQQVSHAFYNRFESPKVNHIRRTIDFQSYLSPSLQDFADTYRINNLFRSRTVALKVDLGLDFPNKAIDPITKLPTSRDDSQQLFSDLYERDGTGEKYWKSFENISLPFAKPVTSYYAAIKQRLDNQYGQIAGITQIPVSTNMHDTVFNVTSKSPVLFNGDIYIGRYTEKNTMFFFYDWLNGQPDGTPFDYKLRKYVTHPRFWMDTDPFDVAEFASSLTNLFQSNSQSGAGSFDPLMVDPKAQQDYEDYTNGLSTTPVNKPVCECGNIHKYSDNVDYTNADGDLVRAACYLADLPCSSGGNKNLTSDINDWCELNAEAEQLTIYRAFVEDCACYMSTGECNPDGDVPNPGASNSDYNTPATDKPCDKTKVSSSWQFPFDPETGGGWGCTLCPSWSGTFGSSAGEADKYFDDDKPKGKWKRKINSLDRKIERAVKRAGKKADKLYKKYFKCLDASGGGFLKKLGDAIQTPTDKFAFDLRKQVNGFTVKDGFMYLFNSGVRDFYVESEINVDYRDWGEKEEERHYDYDRYTDLSALFRSDHIKVGNYMKYDYSLSVSKLFNNFTRWGEVQDRNYDPTLAESCYTYRPKRMLYSMPQTLENKKDNWRVFLSNNYKDFSSTPVNVKAVGKSGALILFDRESPVQFLGTETLKLDLNTKITIGDGELFSQPLQNLANADYPHEYGSCQNRLSAVNTPAGLFYISQNQGKIFLYGGSGLQEISNLGMKWWFAKYLPYKLTDDFPNFELIDNPVVGIGCQSVYDNKNQIVYFCKKDWVLRRDILDTVTYIGGRKFKVNNVLTVDLGDPRYFKSASWTISFDPKVKQWVSHHDWHPGLTLASKNTFMTTNSNSIWVHNNTSLSYCNFYGKDYPFEVEFALHTVGQVNTLRNIMYIMEVYTYASNGVDRYHQLDFNFDEAVIYNSEQCSGLLKLNLQPKNNAPGLLSYPIINSNNIDILYSKEEQKYRFNQFWDITDDRGELSGVQRTIFETEPNGYIKLLNPNNLNYNKFELERKKFRHYKNNVILRRQQCGNKNMIIALAAQLNLNSPR